MGRAEVKREEAAEGTSAQCPCANPVAAAPSTQMASLVQLLEDRALGCEPLTSSKVMSKMLAKGPHSKTTALGVLAKAVAEAVPVFL